MAFNFPIILLSALVPMIVGAIWYNPKVLGNAWMAAAEMTEDKIKGANMAIIFGLAYVFAVLIGIEITFVVIHQNHLDSMFFDALQNHDPEITDLVNKVRELSKHNHRTFGHGAFHGGIAGVLFALPVLGTNALFERKGFKYIAINGLYWIVSLALMGGVICQLS
ncbi:MAG: DUF1761 domain-containing protein [Flavobacteriales bacterium]|nr:DUF1761 domain-containing protein [Bacteroidota bacterium]MCB9239663.1 DUF1761 domain-containing protein [Flavobacteriales bacterium]